MTLSITPVTPSNAPQPATLDVALQPGTVVTAQVLKLLDANLVRMAIANLTLDVATTLPLQPGQTLQLAVIQTKNGISLTQVLPESTSAPRAGAVVLDDIPLAPRLPAQADVVRPALSPAETVAVTAAAQTAATKQTGLSPLFANLVTAASSGSLPQPVLVAAAQVLALRQPGDKPITGSDIKSALASSGLVLEASLATAPPSSTAALPDLKAALTVLRQALATFIGEPSADAAIVAKRGVASQTTTSSPQTTTTAGEASTPSVAARIAGLVPSIMSEAGLSDPMSPTTISSGAASQPRTLASDPSMPLARNAPPPPFRDALPSAQPVAGPSLPPGAEPIAIAQQLLTDTEGALARQTLLQIASLPDRVDMTLPRSETLQPRWNFEIPFVTPQGTAMAQFEIARDGGSEAEAARRVWRARFSLDIEPAGPVHALISFSGNTTSVKMWAERPATAAQLRANAFQLGASLDRAELKTGDIVIADGAPARAQALSAGHFLNRAS